MTSLPKPGGGEFGKYYSLPALNDPRIGKFASSVCYVSYRGGLNNGYKIFLWVSLWNGSLYKKS